MPRDNLTSPYYVYVSLLGAVLAGFLSVVFGLAIPRIYEDFYELDSTIFWLLFFPTPVFVSTTIVFLGCAWFFSQDQKKPDRKTGPPRPGPMAPPARNNLLN